MENMSNAYEDGILYILPRKDMNSLNHAGKMVAQGCHAANHAADQVGQAKFGAGNRTAWMTWEKSTPQAFGTTITLGAVFDTPLAIDTIRQVVGAAVQMGYAGAVISDPTYPLLDGRVTHLFPCETVGWIFGSKTGLEALLRLYKLHGEDAKPL